MKRKHALFYLITAFVLAQLAWFTLLGLWIYWYVVNNLIFEQVGPQLSPQLVIDSPNVLVFVLGIIMMVGIEVAMVFTFRNFTVQLKLTNLYDNFIGNVSHELKSPLASIQLYLETLGKKSVPEDRRKEFYNMMLKDTDRLKKLISSILEISRLEQKRIAHDFRIYDAGEIFQEMIANSSRLFRVPVKVSVSEGSADQRCVVDKEAMQIVFDNLMSNSIKYSSAEPEISVELSNYEKNLFIDFCDRGIGILPKDQKKIFNKFLRITNENVPNVKGTGLGLYWTREIIRFHHGRISVSSEGTGKGTTFRIRLPIYKTAGRNSANSLLRKTARNQKALEDYDR